MAMFLSLHGIQSLKLGPIEHVPADPDCPEHWIRRLVIVDGDDCRLEVTLFSYDPKGFTLDSERVYTEAHERLRNCIPPAQAQARLADIEPYTRPVQPITHVNGVALEGNDAPRGALQALSGLNVDERRALQDIERDNDGVSLAQEYGGEG